MIPPFLQNNAQYGAYLILFGLFLKFVYKHGRPWIKTWKEVVRDKDKAKARRQTATLFSVVVFACAVAFGLLLLLAVTLPPTAPETPIVRLIAGGAGALALMGALILIFGLPAYNSVIDLDERYQKLEDQYLSLNRRNHFLEIRCRSLENRSEKLEEALKELQDQDQPGLLDEHLPVQRNLAFMEMWSVQKRDLAGSQR